MVFPQTILPIKTEIQLNGTWTNITSYVQRRGDEGITIKRGRSDEAGNAEPGQMGMYLNNRDGRFSPRNPVGAYYGLIGRNTPIRCSVTQTTSFLSIDEQTGTTVGTAYVSTPDAAALDIVGDIDIRFDADLNSWREGMEMVTKWTDTGNQKAYRFNLNPEGTMSLGWSADGTANTRDVSTSPVPILSGRIAVRGVLDVNNGAGGRTTTFYTAPTLAGPWTQLGNAITTTGVVSIFSSTAILAVLDNPNASIYGSIIHGKVYGAQVYNSVGTLVANPDFTAQTDGATSFVDSTAKTWTLNGSVSLTTRDTRFHGEVTNWPQKWDTTGTDVYVPVECSGLLRRLGQGTPDLASTLTTGISNLTGVVAYWPMEDDDTATQGASGLASGQAMVPTTGQPDWAADDSFKASNPIPTFNGSALRGKITAYPTTNIIQLQFLIHVPTGGAVTESTIARVITSGTAARWDVVYRSSSSGAIALIPYDEDGVVIAGGASTGFGINGKLIRYSLELTPSGANIAWKHVILRVGDAIGLAGTGTVNSKTIRSATQVILNPELQLTDTSIGQIEVNNAITDIFDLSSQLNAYNGETAGRRVERLCREQGVTFAGYGDLDDSPAMGYQTPAGLLDLLRDCEDADPGGILGETRDQLALSYRPASSMYRQASGLQLDYNLFQLAELEPVEDDQLIRNDVTVKRPGGSSARVAMDSGALSTLAPPLGVGRYDTSLDVNLQTDDQLQDHAGWRVRLGTIDEARYPTVAVNLAHASFSAAQAIQAAAVDTGTRVTVINPPAWIPPDPISLLVQGYTEFLSNYERTLDWNCSPSSPNDQMGFYGVDARETRYSPDTTTVSTTMNTTVTTMVMATAAGNELWITTALLPGDFPIPVMVEGEEMIITAITSSTSPQTATVTRSVNGVVKSHTAGALITLYQPAYWAI